MNLRVVFLHLWNLKHIHCACPKVNDRTNQLSEKVHHRYNSFISHARINELKKGEGLSPCYFFLLFSPAPPPPPPHFFPLRAVTLSPTPAHCFLPLPALQLLCSLRLNSNPAVDSRLSVKESKVQRAFINLLALY